MVSNSGPDDTGATFDRLWQLNSEAGVKMVDEHYYNSPTWFLENNDRYDSYDRNGPEGLPRRVRLAGQQVLQRAEPRPRS